MVSDHWSPLWSHIAPSGWCSSALQSPGERKRWNHNQIKNWGSTLNSLSISPCLQSWPRLPRNSLNKLRWIFGIDLAIGNQAKKLNSCQKGFRLIFAEWKLLKKHLGIVAPLTCWRQQGELPAMSQKPFWLFWCNDSHSLAPPHCHFSWAICVTADRVVWPQISWWQSSFVSAAQLYPGLPLFCRWASTFPGYLSTFPMHGFCNDGRYCWMSERAAGRWFSDAPHRFPLQTQPRPGKEPTTTNITLTWHPHNS